MSKIFRRRQIRGIKQRNTYDWGLHLCSTMYYVVSNTIVNFTRKALKDQLFSVKIEEYLGSDSKSGGNDSVSSLRQNPSKEYNKMSEKAKEISCKSNKTDKYENMQEDETIKMIRQEIDQKGNNLYIRPNKEIEEAKIWVKDFNSETNCKSNEIRKEIGDENVLSTETRQINNGVGSDHDLNDNDNYDKERREYLKIDNKYHKNQSFKLIDINQEANDTKFDESKLKGISKSGKCCQFVRQMMLQVWFFSLSSYNLICNYLQSKINKWELSKVTIQKYLPGLIKAMHNCGIEFNSDSFKDFVVQCEPEVKSSKIISNYQEIINKVVSSKTHKQCKLFLADCLIYNLMFITNCSEEMLLSLKLSDIWEYIDTSDS